MENIKNNENLLIRLEEVCMDIEGKKGELKKMIAEILEIEFFAITKYSVVKKAVDSRNKVKINFVYSIDVEIKDPEAYVSNLENASKEMKDKAKRHRIRLFEPYVYNIEKVEIEEKHKRPMIVGSGPSGLFCALVLAKAGLKPIVIERGCEIDDRVKDVDKFFKEGVLNTKSNIQFGEGGAGTFSDGKLYTLVKNPRTKYIFDELVRFGAPREITRDAKPHIGTDKLRDVVKNIRKEIVALGGEVRFETCLTDIETEDGKILFAILNGKERISVDDLIIATGHSARDTYEMLLENDLKMEQKPFSIGLRIEHKAEVINKSQYRKAYNHPKLPTADYKLVAHMEGLRSVYTFCMCPGGYVIGATSEEGGVVTNGMSLHKRDGENSNSALLVNVNPEDFESDHPLAGMEFQRHWEQKAFVAGGENYNAPVQLVGDFLNKKRSKTTKSVEPTCMPGSKPTALDHCLPKYVIESIRAALPLFENKIKGFADHRAILTGVETRSSAPVRVYRDDTLQSNIKGVYPTGEGAGYAGGIVSSAIDGLKVAEALIEKFSGK